ncbi:MAG: DUF1080 domain-containing protein [Verrucomicrobia bacterium]|nr:DUF1080 domain-containing protein [Verrucomicrobiota bacterium]
MKTTNLVACICLITSPLFAADPPPVAAKPVPSGNGRKVEKAPNFIPTKPDPMMGDWKGQGGIVAQVFPTGDGKYQANLLTAFDTESNVVAILQGTAADGTVTFSGDGWSGAIKGAHFIGGKDDKKFDLQHIVRVSPTEGAKPPAGAIVLFDGSNLDAWAKKSGKDWLMEDGPAKWKLVEGGAMEVVPDTDCIITHKKFGDCHVHVEFRTLGLPSNSGVFLEDRYEANINETYGRLTGTPNGGFDNCTDKVEPRVRPCFPPLVWQTFDIDFTAPKFDAGGNKTASARATVLFNGVKIYDNQELDLPHGAAARMGEAPTGPLMLQEHGMPVQFRNVWLVDKTR